MNSGRVRRIVISVVGLAELEEQVARGYARLGLLSWPDPHPGTALPREEEYSRVSAPERYRIVHARARVWVERLVEVPARSRRSRRPLSTARVVSVGSTAVFGSRHACRERCHCCCSSATCPCPGTTPRWRCGVLLVGSLQKSILITTRRGVGWLTSLRPAAAKTPTAPTCSSSGITFVVTIG